VGFLNLPDPPRDEDVPNGCDVCWLDVKLEESNITHLMLCPDCLEQEKIAEAWQKHDIERSSN
jgi:hypothetical protein